MCCWVSPGSLSNLPRFPPRAMSSAINPTHSSLFTRPRDGLIRKAWSGLLGIVQQYSYVTTLQSLPFSVNLIRPVFSTLSWDSSLFASSFPPKQSFRVVVAFWCHRHYQQVFELCVNQHKHFDDTVLLSLAMEFQRAVEETGWCFASRLKIWKLEKPRTSADSRK